MKKMPRMDRREMLRLSMMFGSATLIGRSAFGQLSQAPGFCSTEPPPFPIHMARTGLDGIIEAFPTSPFILNPFTDPLPRPKALRPGWRQPDGKLDPSSTDAWTVRRSSFYSGSGIVKPGPENGHQDTFGERPRRAFDRATGITYDLPPAGTHQLWGADPILYHIRLQVAEHCVTSSPVLPYDANGFPSGPPPAIANATRSGGGWLLPKSTIYGFNGTFPGPMINCEYGRPVLIRFENDLDYNPYCLNRQDFGAPDWAFLTHLHNGHTAPESDGNPHHMTENEGGYQPGEWVDNLYLGYSAGGDYCEKQSFLWFHDHRMHHTGANVYKGMVGLMPHYDADMDCGDENGVYGVAGKKKRSKYALRLPGRRTDNGDGTFDVDYDIPMALYDCCLDDGITPHEDFHNGLGELHPEWWGKSYFRHFPNHGFVGDIFTINGTAYPVLHVERRKYRLRFLGASIARCYQLWLMSGTPVGSPGSQGQWQIPNGQQCMKFTQIAAEGGLLPRPIVRDSFEIWPAKRREFVVDFSRYMDNRPTSKGDEIYLVNTMLMVNGRKPAFPGEPDFNPNYRVPMMKIVIGDLPKEPDASVIPSQLRPMPSVPSAKQMASLPHRTFTLQRGSSPNAGIDPMAKETEWLINGLEFDALNPLALPKRGVPEVWTVQNGGGGWVHPMHIHQEEHTVLSRNGVSAPDARHPDDIGKEDVIALDPSEQVVLYRNFRTFRGNYVAHCHNLAHEDHNMMFGWTIV